MLRIWNESSEERRVRAYLTSHDATCPACGYSLKGLRSATCPECGRDFGWQDLRSPETRISWRTAAVDLVGLGVTVGINVLLVVFGAVAVLMYQRQSWFTRQLWTMNRGPRSISGVLVIVLGLSVMAWAWEWERSDMDSWRKQNALAMWCWVLTGIHVVGCLSLWV